MPANTSLAGQPAPRHSPDWRAHWLGLLAGAILAIGTIAVYSRTFSVPLLLDDSASIADNPTIRHLWPIGPVLAPPSGGITVSGRPVLNLTLAINYALGGTQVRGYHAVNLAIHIMAGLTLFGIARRIFRPDATVAFATALLWTLHPLQTESVTYIIQRAESLMGLFYLLTLYCFIRHAESQDNGQPAWRIRLFSALSVFFCLLGMATKEIMVSAPIVALLVDRTFLAGSFREAWRRRRMLHLGLASTWVLLGYLVIREGGNRSGSIGFGVGVSWWAYGLTQFQAVAHYLRLAVWPHPLVFEYGVLQARDIGQVAPFACLIVLLAAVTILALVRWPAWGFLGFWFFAILAPTSLVSGATQSIAEHRMYLALAPVLMAIIGGGHALMRLSTGAQKASAPQGPATFPAPAAASGRRGPGAAPIVLIVLAGACGVMAAWRNEDYRSALALWSDTVSKQPDNNPVANNNLGAALARMPGRLDDAIAQFEEALRLRPDDAEAHYNLGGALSQKPGRLDDAIAQYQEALRLRTALAEKQKDFADARDDFAKAHNGLGLAWSNQPGRSKESIAQYEEALRLKPDYADAHNNLGVVLCNAGRVSEALPHYQQAIRIDPSYYEAHYNLGSALSSLGRTPEAVSAFQDAVRLAPAKTAARNALGNALYACDRFDEAMEQFRAVTRLDPGNADAHNNLGTCLAARQQIDAALVEFKTAVRLRPDFAAAEINWGHCLEAQGNPEAALEHLRRGAQLQSAR